MSSCRKPSLSGSGVGRKFGDRGGSGERSDRIGEHIDVAIAARAGAGLNANQQPVVDQTLDPLYLQRRPSDDGCHRLEPRRVEETLELRDDSARLLGSFSYAHVSAG